MPVRTFASILLLAAILGLSFVIPSRASAVPPNTGAVPIIVGVQPTTVYAGSDVNITVVLSETVSTNQEVRVSTDSSMFTNWTPYVTVPAGSDRVTFTRTLSSTADGGFSVAASCNNRGAASPFVSIASYER